MNAAILSGSVLAETWVGSALDTLSSNQRFALLIIGLSCLTSIVISSVAMISGMVQAMHRSRIEAEIKRDMLDRGMTADEIAKVVEASTPRDFLERWASNRCRKKSA